MARIALAVFIRFWRLLTPSRHALIAVAFITHLPPAVLPGLFWGMWPDVIP